MSMTATMAMEVRHVAPMLEPNERHACLTTAYLSGSRLRAEDGAERAHRRQFGLLRAHASRLRFVPGGLPSRADGEVEFCPLANPARCPAMDATTAFY